MKNISIIKYDNTRQLYNQEKVINSLLKAGIKKEQIPEILTRIEQQLYDGIPAKDLYEIVFQEINNQGLSFNSRFYRLREALSKIQPIDFEKFICHILEKLGFVCQWNKIVKGFCIEHQIDIIAEKEKQLYFIEVKHHRNFHRYTDLGSVAELWARLEDLQKGFKTGNHQNDFKIAWLVTNTKFSDYAKEYGRCKSLWLTGWNFDLEGLATERKPQGLQDKINILGEKEIDNLIRKIIFKDKTIS